MPKPKYVFRLTNIQSADGITAAIGAAQGVAAGPSSRPIHPDYSYGRNVQSISSLAIERLFPARVGVRNWPKLGTTDFTAHITKLISKSGLLISASGAATMWPSTSRRFAMACSTR